MRPQVIVAQRPGVERRATPQEVCQHWMVRQETFSAAKQLRKCAFCGRSDWVETK